MSMNYIFINLYQWDDKEVGIYLGDSGYVNISAAEFCYHAISTFLWELCRNWFNVLQSQIEI